MTAPAPALADLPTSREEAWRYTPVDQIVACLESSTAPSDVPVTRATLDRVAGAHGDTRLVFVNGWFDAELSDHAMPAGVWSGLADQPRSPIAETVALASIDRATNGFVHRNHVDGRDVAVIVVEPGVRVERPIHIVHLAAATFAHPPTDTTVLTHPRTIVDVGDDSQVGVVQTYCGVGQRLMTNASTSVRLGRRASLDHVRIQSEPGSTVHVGHTRVEQGEGSRLRSTSITVGAEIARNAIDVHLGGADAVSDLTGIDIATGRQRHDTVVQLDHVASGCASTQRFAGVVGDHGRASFTGEIIVRPGTVATDAHQSIRNLVLSPDAEADARPWLRILADDVRCTHGASTGRLDDEALFYLRSRGIPLPTARSMLIDAFVRDITDAVTDESVRAHVASLITATHATGRDADGVG